MKRSKRILLIILIILCLLLIGLVALRVGHVGRSVPTPTPITQFEFVPLPMSLPSPEPEPSQEPASEPISKIILEAGAEIEWPCGIPFHDPGFKAYGAEGEEMDNHVTVEGEVVPWHTGDYTLRYTLTDNGLELDRVQRTVHVVPQKTKEPVKPESGTICLTYIDTPCEPTEELLKLLKRDEVKATFFVSTHQSEFLDLLSQIAEDGHELGIYLPNYSWYAGEEGVLEHCLSEIVSMQEIIFEKTGRYAKFIRFNGGTTNAYYLAVRFPGGYQELFDTMHEMGLLVFDWNLEVDVADVTAKISSNFTHPSDPYEYVVAMQQNFRRQSVLAVPEMIRWGKEKGYTFSVLEDTYPEVFLGQEETKPYTPPVSPSPDPDKKDNTTSRIPSNVDISSLETTIAALQNEIDSLGP